MKTLILGASTNPERYANKAIKALRSHDHEVVAIGKTSGSVAGVEIQADMPTTIEGLDTVSLYLGPANQASVQEAILALKPKRIVFNPGTENPEFAKAAEAQGIHTVEACTLVLLATDQYAIA